MLWSKEKHAPAITVIVVAAIFYGDIYVGVTLPLMMLLLPLLISQIKSFRLILVPAGICLIAGLGLVVLAQAVFGYWPRVRSDFVPYLAVVYATPTLLLFSQVRLDARQFAIACAVGAVVSGTLMVLTITFAPPDFLWVKSQYIPYADEVAEDSLLGSNSHNVVVSVSPGTMEIEGESSSLPKTGGTIGDSDIAFYDLKNKAKNALGFSNYIAVFFIACLSVVLFANIKLPAKLTISTILILLTLATLSRFSLIFICLTLLSRFLYQRVKVSLIAFGLVALSILGCVIIFLLHDTFIQYPELASIVARINYWRTGLALINVQNFLGSPKSYFIEKIGASIYWNPHNSFLWIWAIFGGAGILLYISYIVMAARSVLRAAEIDSGWYGAFFAIVIMVCWSLVEPIALTPAFELFVASAYGLTFRLRTQTMAAKA